MEPANEMDWSNPVQVKTENPLTLKEEPIDTSFIKTENIEERPFVISLYKFYL